MQGNKAAKSCKNQTKRHIDSCWAMLQHIVCLCGVVPGSRPPHLLCHSQSVSRKPQPLSLSSNVWVSHALTHTCYSFSFHTRSGRLQPAVKKVCIKCDPRSFQCVSLHFTKMTSHFKHKFICKDWCLPKANAEIKELWLSLHCYIMQEIKDVGCISSWLVFLSFFFFFFVVLLPNQRHEASGALT